MTGSYRIHRLSALERPRRPRAAPVLDQAPPREPAAPRGRRERRGGRRRGTGPFCGRGRRRAGRSPTRRPGSSCRTSPACRASSTSRRCETPSRRSAGAPSRINPLVPVDLVIDHSVVADVYGRRDALEVNTALEYERNAERYRFLRWGQQAFSNFRVVPPGTGICHQFNLEYLSSVVFTDAAGAAYPDTVVGTDSHTPMVNGLGVLAWGVGGIEAEAAMLGQPISMLVPAGRGSAPHRRAPRRHDRHRPRPHGRRAAAAPRRRRQVRRVLRARAWRSVPLENRATIGNMSPEYGSTVTIFPIDAETLRYLRLTGRPEERCSLVEAYAKEQGLWHDESAEPDLLRTTRARPVDDRAEPRRPVATPRPRPAAARQGDVRRGPRRARSPSPARRAAAGGRRRRADVRLADGTEFSLDHGHVVIAAITSCTNTSNPQVMIGAGLAGEEGRRARPRVQAVGEDEPRARAPGSSWTTSGGPGSCPTSRSSASISSVSAARPASATRARCLPRSRRPSTPTAWRVRRCCRAIATSRDGSIPTSG